MSAAAATPNPEPGPADPRVGPADPAAPQLGPADPAADDAYYRQILHDLIESGTKLALAAAEDPEIPTPERIELHERATRAIRRSIVLVRHIAEHPLTPAQSAPSNPAAARRTLARKQIIRAVDDAVERRKGEGTDADALRGELCERLDAPDLDDDIANRPIEDIIAEIVRDLGLADIPGRPPWPRRSADCVRALAALAAAPTGAAALAVKDEPQPQPAARPASPRPSPRQAPPPYIADG